MPRAGNVDHVEVVLLDHPVQVNVDEIETWCGSPMAQEPRLDVILCEGLLEQRVVVEMDLADRQVVGGPPVRIHQCPLFVGQHVCHHCLLVHVIECADAVDRAYQSSRQSRRCGGSSAPADAISISSRYFPTLAAPLDLA